MFFIYICFVHILSINLPENVNNTHLKYNSESKQFDTIICTRHICVWCEVIFIFY